MQKRQTQEDDEASLEEETLTKHEVRHYEVRHYRREHSINLTHVNRFSSKILRNQEKER